MDLSGGLHIVGQACTGEASLRVASADVDVAKHRVGPIASLIGGQDALQLCGQLVPPFLSLQDVADQSQFQVLSINGCSIQFCIGQISTEPIDFDAAETKGGTDIE